MGITLESNVDTLVETIQCRAMEIIALPLEQRDEHYKTIQDVFRFAARELGADEASAEKQGAKMVEFIAALMKIIQAGGGEAGSWV